MFKIVWDKEHNGVRLTQNSRGEALNLSPRPVFWEELDFLRLAERHGWRYPHCHEPLLWACERRYFYRGEVVLEVHGGNLFDAPSVEPRVEGLQLEPVDIAHLRSANEDAMFIIEHEAMNFIADTYRRYSGMAATTAKNPDIDFQQLAEGLTKRTRQSHVVVREDCDSFDIMPLSEAERQGKQPVLSGRVEMFIASFSGGKDSQVVLDLVSRVLPPEAFLVIYSDTGYELPTSLALYEQVQQHYHALTPNLRFYTARNHQPVLYYWDEMGSPSNTHRWCCSVMKTAPLYLKLKEISGLGRQPHVVSYIGTRAEESARRSTYDKIAKDAKHTNVVNVNPILEWNTTEVWLYLLLHSVPFNTAYRAGVSRVGCIICPFGSDWNEHVCLSQYKEQCMPFVEKLREIAERNGVKDTDVYIKAGGWKVRGSGKSVEKRSGITILEHDLRAVMHYPTVDIEVWLSAIGQYSVEHKHNSSIYTVKFGEEVVRLYVVRERQDILVETKDIVSAQFLTLLRRVLNKSTYCVQCEMCEVDCPTGALRITPRITIDKNKCIHCHRCIAHIDEGCKVAESIKLSGMNTMSSQEKQMSFDKYFNFGMRERWVEYYLQHYDTYFENTEHGLNVNKQVPSLVNWMNEAEIISKPSKKITEKGLILSERYGVSCNVVWEVIWITLSYNSGICNWWCSNIDYYRTYEKNEVEAMMENTLTGQSKSSRGNSFAALQNTFKESPIGGALKVCIIHKEGRNISYVRQPHNDLSLVAVAYSLYRYAEKVGRWDLTLGELYNEQQKEGIVRQFGIEREALERKLRSLQEEENRVLSVELNMGLDNINLRRDLTSTDVLRMLL